MMDKELQLALQGLRQNRDFLLFLRWLHSAGNMAGNPFAANALQMSLACGKMALAQEAFHLLRTANPQSFPGLMKEIYSERPGTADRDTTAD